MHLICASWPRQMACQVPACCLCWAATEATANCWATARHRCFRWLHRSDPHPAVDGSLIGAPYAMSGGPTTARLWAGVSGQCPARPRPASANAASPRLNVGAPGRRGAKNRQHGMAPAALGLRPPETLERQSQHQHIQPSRQEEQAAADRSAPDSPTGAAVAAAAGGGGAADLLPKLALLGAAALWGSYAPSVRLLYESANPPDAVVVMAARGVLQSAVMLLATLALQRSTGGSAGGSSSSDGTQAGPPSSSSSSVDNSTGSQMAGSSSGGGSGGSALEDWLLLRSPKLWQAALELGFFNYSATWLQARAAAAAQGKGHKCACRTLAVGRRSVSTLPNQPPRLSPTPTPAACPSSPCRRWGCSWWAPPGPASWSRRRSCSRPCYQHSWGTAPGAACGRPAAWRCWAAC